MSMEYPQREETEENVPFSRRVTLSQIWDYLNKRYDGSLADQNPELDENEEESPRKQ